MVTRAHPKTLKVSDKILDNPKVEIGTLNRRCSWMIQHDNGHKPSSSGLISTELLSVTSERACNTRLKVFCEEQGSRVPPERCAQLWEMSTKFV